MTRGDESNAKTKQIPRYARDDNGRGGTIQRGVPEALGAGANCIVPILERRGRDEETRRRGDAESARMWTAEARDGTPVYCDLRERGGRGLPRFLPHLAGVPYAKRDGRGRRREHP